MNKNDLRYKKTETLMINLAECYITNREPEIGGVSAVRITV